MVSKYYLKLLLFLTLLVPVALMAQISQGGRPIEIMALKSSASKIIVLPAIQEFVSTDNIADAQKSLIKLKPFQFAYPFEVNLNSDNSGEWFHTDKGFNVWKLKIRSSGAESLNLIFDEFNLPDGARLFLFNENENYILGAYTSFNNSPSGKFAVSPVLGDELTVQYELPETIVKEKHFRIATINHDYVGILKAGGRRPLDKVAGTCNIDVNCDEWESWGEVKNSVCRMIVNGKEVCSGVLLNNTAENQKPYILSAAHCYDKWNYPEVTVYTFNYESPFCKPLDGDPSNSISGAVMKAQFDSLDFALVQLRTVPPPTFRPYFAGWNRTISYLPASTVSIHHPQGDVKKLTIDRNPPSIASFNKDYKKDGFLKISRWEGGVTEAGSSGGPLFDPEYLVIGTLTGGEATCKNPVNDYFERFSLSWDSKADTTKQLKYWLDPLKSGALFLYGKQFYRNENLCGAYTNLTDADDYSIVPLLSGGKFAGYWGGSNSAGITEIMERFTFNGHETLAGISMGVAKFNKVLKSNDSEIKIKVYNGYSKPEKLIYSQVVKTAGLAQDAMNYIGFSEEVRPEENFFVGFELSNIQPLDSFVVYQSLRAENGKNSFYFKQNGNWYNFKDANSNGKSISNIFELIACNVGDFNADTPHVDNPHDIFVFPNPSNAVFTVEAGTELPENKVAVFNLIGQKVQVKIVRISQRKVSIDLTGNVPGVYLVRFDSGEGVISRKISFVPW